MRARGSNASAGPERQAIDEFTKLAVVASMIAFILPFIGGVIAFVMGTVAKARLRRRGGDRMNEGLAFIAQATAIFTLVLYGGFVWYAQIRGI